MAKYPSGYASQYMDIPPQQALDFKAPMISRMLEELSWQPNYEYALFSRDILVSQDLKGEYRIKVRIPHTQAIAVIGFNHRRATPPFSML